MAFGTPFSRQATYSYISPRRKKVQYHLNGYRPGDPSIAEPVTGADIPSATVDVLIIGCGLAGLTLAAQLAAFPRIVTRIFELKPGPLERGQADGVACRSMEMFFSFPRSAFLPLR